MLVGARVDHGTPVRFERASPFLWYMVASPCSGRQQRALKQFS